MNTHHVFLIPGFFGFANLGELKYFSHVREVLEPRLAELGCPPIIHDFRPPPTASLRARARRLGEAIGELDLDEDDAVHLIGHSTGGLDARMLVSPGAQLGIDLEPVARRVRSVVCVATPHHGVPLAGSLLGVAGGSVLRALSLATVDVVRNGRLTVGTARVLLRVVAALGDRSPLTKSVPDQLYDLLLDDFSPDRRREVARFFEEVAGDQSLIADLRPRSLRVILSGLSDRPGVNVGAVVSRARRPGLVESVFKQGLDPYGQTMHTVFRGLYDRSGFANGDAPPLPTDRAVMARLTAAWGDVPTPRSSDGIVPTMSQLRGDLIHACRADHLDVVGHFGGIDHAPPHYDWLPSGSGFRRQHFESLWDAVARYIARA